MTAPQISYWGGSTVVGGQVRKLDATTFTELVDRHFNSPVCLPYTREEWTALDEKERNKAKDGPYVCACSFKEGTKLRNDTNADLLQMVCVDIDDPELARDFTASPDSLSDALWPNSFIAYHTASSTPENPRLRIMVPVEPCDPAEHKRVTFYVVHSRLGLPRKWAGRRESFTLSLPFYRPVKLQGEDFKAIIASRTTGEPVQLRDLPQEVTEEVDRIYAYQDGFDEDSDLTNLPVTGLEVEDIREPLFKIDPDCGYQQWTQIACAGLHQFRDEDSSREFFEMFVDWSSGGDTFRGEDDCYAKWKSFRPDYKGRRPVTIKSLFKWAMDAGWVNTKIIAKVKESVDERIQNCEDINVLMNEAPEWVAAMPFVGEIMEHAMAEVIKARLQQLRAPKVSSTVILRAIQKDRRKARQEQASGNRPAWLRPWCYVSSIDRFYSTATGVLLTPEAFNRNFGLEMMAFNQDAAANGRPIMSAADFALNTEGMITKVDAMVYDPRFGGENHFFRMPGDDRLFVNEYRAASVPKLDEKNSAKAGKAFKRLLRDQLPEKEHVLYLLDWAAHLVQFPGVQIRHAPCIQGGHGSGKTFISRYMGAAIGRTNSKIVGPKVISTDFNGWAYGAVLVTIEEIWAQGKSKAETMNSLKPLLTNDQVEIHRKGKDSVDVENTTNYIAYTNQHNALHLDEGDRRWWVLKSKIQTKQQVLALFDTMIAGMKAFKYHGLVVKKYAGAIRHFLLNYEIRSSFDPDGPAPDTPWRRQMIETSKNPLQREIEYAIRDNAPLVGDDVIYLPALMRRLEGTPSAVAAMKHNHPVEHYLYQMNFQPHSGGQRFGVNGSGKGEIWVNMENYEAMFGHPLDIIMERYAKIPDETI